jgi:predicted CoA-binding protein
MWRCLSGWRERGWRTLERSSFCDRGYRPCSMQTELPLEDLRRIYAETNVIAVVGASPDSQKTSNVVPSYLQAMGYTIVPVNPNHESVFGVPSYPSLSDIPGPVDVVEVFRPGAEAPELARQAALIGAKVLWLQVGIESEEAGGIAQDAGMTFVSDTCMGAMHAKLGLGPGPYPTD